MHERTRYRISGSLFLLALAVIFLPMIFDGQPQELTPIPDMPQAVTPEEIPSYDTVVPETDLEVEVATLQREVDEDGFAVTGELFGEPRLREETQDTRIWAVQSASFAKSSNAKALREALKEAGFKAFISTVKPAGEGNPMYRVAVGPLQQRADAEAILAQIAAGFDLSPRIVEMQP